MYQSAGRHQTGKVFENPLWENVFEKPAQVLFDGMNNYTDHLGNVRLSYSMDHLTGKLKILDETEARGSRTPKKRRSHKTNNSEQNHYYPFGLRHEVYLTGSKLDFSRNPGDGIEPEPGLPPVLDYVTRMEYQYKYNGKEFQDELGMNIYDYGARNYDPAIGRFFNLDRYAFDFMPLSPYNYAANNPVSYLDYNGDYIIMNQQNDNGDVILSLMYENGQAYWYSKDKKGNVIKGDKYDGNSSFISETITNINKIGNTNQGAALVYDLQSSDEQVNIFNASSPKKINYDSKTNSVSYMAGRNVSVDGAYTPDFIALGHELYHAWDHLIGPNNVSNRRLAEQGAVEFGNYLRVNYGINSLRTRYSWKGQRNMSGFQVSNSKSYYQETYSLTPLKVEIQKIGGRCNGCDNISIAPRYIEIPTLTDIKTKANSIQREIKIKQFKSSLP